MKIELSEKWLNYLEARLEYESQYDNSIRIRNSSMILLLILQRQRTLVKRILEQVN